MVVTWLRSVPVRTQWRCFLPGTPRTAWSRSQYHSCALSIERKWTPSVLVARRYMDRTWSRRSERHIAKLSPAVQTSSLCPVLRTFPGQLGRIIYSADTWENTWRYDRCRELQARQAQDADCASLHLTSSSHLLCRSFKWLSKCLRIFRFTSSCFF